MLFARLLAGFLGLATLAVEARHSYDGLRSLWANLDDYAVGLFLLLAAGWAPRRGGAALRAGAFGFAGGLFYKVFLRRLGTLMAAPTFQLDPLSCAVGVGLLLALSGLVVSIREAMGESRSGA